MTNPIAEAIRVLRDTGLPRHESEHVFYLAIASALEELDERTRFPLETYRVVDGQLIRVVPGIPPSIAALQPPAEKRGEAGGEVPEPLPEVLPVGTRTVNGDTAKTEVRFGLSGYVGTWTMRATYNAKERDVDGCIWAQNIDWAHYRRTHSPPPSREGEALPSFRNHRDMGHPGNQTAYLMWTDGDRLQGRADDQDLAACLAAMPEERRERLLTPFAGELGETLLREQAVRHRITDERVAADARAEAAEERAAELTRELEQEKADALSQFDSWNKELEAARARVGKLHAIARDAVYELRNSGNAYAGRFSDMVSEVMREPTPSAPSPASTFAAVADALPTNAEDERIVDALMAKRPTLTRRFVSGAHVYKHYGVETCKESPPRDSGGETTGAKRWDTGKDQWTHGEKMPGDWHKFLGPCPSCGSRCFNYGGGWRCLGQYCRNSANNPAPNVGPIPWWWETDIQVVSVGTDWEARGMGTWAQGGTPEHAVAVLRAAKERTHEQREGQAQEAEAKPASGATGDPAVAPVDAAPAVGRCSGPNEGTGADRVAPPGLTPEEAEEGARRMYLHAFGMAPWHEMNAGYRGRLAECYRFAHSEGAKAAKAKVVTTLRPIIAGLDHLRGRFDSVFEALERLGALAAELEAKEPK